MRASDFDYVLPPDRIAQHPPAQRTASRLMVVHRAERRIEHTAFTDIGRYLRTGDLLVLNDSRVIPARLRGHKQQGGGAIEILLLEPHSEGGWNVLLRPGKRVKPGTVLVLEGGGDHLPVTVLQKDPSGVCRLGFRDDNEVLAFAEQHGEVPLPPYITRLTTEKSHRERYQTVYAHAPGSVAAPTAGLHFSEELLHDLRARGIRTCRVTLHVGMGTFAPVKAESLHDHVMHSERYAISSEAAEAINQARGARQRIVAVGTTSLRVLESVARAHNGCVVSGEGRTDLFLYPPADFLVTDALLTNFHLPRSTLLMLVSAFATPGSTEGRDFILSAYEQAISQGYRFFSYGDAMFLV